MKNFGFTLAEILITLGLIGVLSALMAPTVTNIMPDKDKITVLKIYNNLSEINQTILDDPTLYFSRGGKFGLASPTSTTPATTRYPEIIKQYLAKEPSTTSDFKCDNDANCSLTCTITQDLTCDFRITMTYKDRSSHCSYSSSCNRPDRFDFEIDNFGTIRPVDNLSKAYLMNPLHTNQKKLDYEKASSL